MADLRLLPTPPRRASRLAAFMALAFTLGSTLALLSGCQPAGTSVAAGERFIDITRIAKVMVTPGTSKVLGTIRLPQALVSGASTGSLGDLVMVPGAKVRVVDEHGVALADTPIQITGTDGVFTFSSLPLGVSLTLKAEIPLSGKTLHLTKVIRPTDALTCAHLDLATTLVADKLLSTSPLFKADSGLEGADLYDLYLPFRLLDVERRVREALKGDPAADLADVVSQLAQGDTSGLLEALAQEDPSLADDYHQAFERPDSSLVVDIKTSAVGTNSIGVDSRNVVFGVVTLKVVGAPDKTVRMEYWAKSTQQQKIAESTTSESWEATIDTWTLPEGDCTLDTVAILDNGKKILVGRSYLSIQNSLANVCPLP